MPTTRVAAAGSAAKDGARGAKAPTPRRAKRPRRTGAWTAAKRDQFLAELARTCNVTASAKAVRLPERSAYALRAKLPAFREAWADALRAGYQALELKLVARSLVAMEGGAEATAPEKQADAQALRLLAAHREAATGAQPGKARPRRSPLDVIDAALARHEAKPGG